MFSKADRLSVVWDIFFAACGRVMLCCVIHFSILGDSYRISEKTIALPRDGEWPRRAIRYASKHIFVQYPTRCNPGSATENVILGTFI